MVEALNAAQLDYATFGNHEFELPRDTLIARIAASSFKWLSANCTLADGTRFPEVLPWDTVRVSGHLVGLFGLTLQGDYRSYVRCTDPDSAAPGGGRHAHGAEGGSHRRAHPPDHRGGPRTARPRAAHRSDPGRARARGARLGGLRPARAQGGRQLPDRAVRHAVGRQGRRGGRRSDWSPSTPGSPTTARWRRWWRRGRTACGRGSGRSASSATAEAPIDARDALSRNRESPLGSTWWPMRCGPAPARTSP